MKSLTVLAGCFSALVSQASAHYMFQYFTYGGVEGAQYQYIRPNTNNNSPVILLNSTDLRCNEGGISGAGTSTITVQAGHAFSFRADIPVYHAGPLSIYMAKAPGAAADFDGSGTVWFKILDLGPTFDANNVATWPLAQIYNYTIPPALPNGDYLLRIQQLGIHNPYPGGIPQFYIECAQVTVTGGGSGTPGPLVAIPGFIDGTEPGYVANIYNQFYNYTVPGPAVWAGQSASGGGAATTSKASSTTLRTSTVTSSTRATTSSSSVRSTTASSSSSTRATTSSSSTRATTSSTSTKASTTSSSTKASTTSSSAVATGSCIAVALYGQCGGSTISPPGCRVCTAGTCSYVNDFYSQCT